MVKACVSITIMTIMRSVAKIRVILIVGVWRRLEKVEIALGRQVEMCSYWFEDLSLRRMSSLLIDSRLLFMNVNAAFI